MHLTIGIPTYNGELTIKKVLDSILGQMTEGVEIVISDNASTDNTSLIANEYALKDSNIRYFRNEKNVGMDNNFDLVVKRAQGKFVWILSDDDYISNENAIKKVLEAIKKAPNSGTIFVNYENDIIPIDRDYYNIDGNEFFRITKFKSTLISSTIVNRKIWNDIDKKEYIGTYWTHIVYLINANSKFKSCILSDIYAEQIKYERSERRWGNNGTFFNVGIDLAKIYLNLSILGYEKDVCREAKRYIKQKNYWNIPVAKIHNLGITTELISDCIKVFWFFPSFWFIDLPLLLIPRYIYKTLHKIYKKTKKRLVLETKYE